MLGAWRLTCGRHTGLEPVELEWNYPDYLKPNFPGVEPRTNVDAFEISGEAAHKLFVSTAVAKVNTGQGGLCNRIMGT
jgi:hypothetical protein